MSDSINVTGIGSLVNAMYRQTAPIEPEENMGATILLWTDRHAATITSVNKDRTRVWVARDKAIRLDGHGMSEEQSYRYERTYPNDQECYTLRNNGRWVRRGESMTDGTSLLLGQRCAYHDYSF